MAFEWLLGSFGKRGWVSGTCRFRMVHVFNHALLPLSGCGESDSLGPAGFLAFGYQRHVFMSLAAGLLALQYSDRLDGRLACWVFAVWFSVLLNFSADLQNMCCIPKRKMAVTFVAQDWHSGGLVPPFWHFGGLYFANFGTLGAPWGRDAVADFAHIIPELGFPSGF